MNKKTFRTNMWGSAGAFARNAATVTDCMDGVRAAATGVNSFLTFERFEGIDTAILDALRKAVREVFGPGFLGYYNNQVPDQVFVLPSRDGDKIELSVRFTPRYKGKGLFKSDPLADYALSNAARDAIDRRVEAALHTRWPDAKVWMQHEGHHKHTELPGYYYSLLLTVQVEPEFRGLKVAA